MSFDNVLRRYCDPQDFSNSYKSLCGLQDSIPINIVRSHIKNRELELNADKVRIFDWPPVINAIKFDRSLEKISIFSTYKHHLKTRRKTLRFKMNCPAIHTREVARRVAVAVSNCLKKSEQISKLELQGIPFSEKDLLIIANGISKNEALSHLSIDYCPISDRALASICKSLGKHPSVTKISFNGCNLSTSSAKEISSLLHQQLLTHHTQRWAESLRYRTPDLRRMGGIRRVSLNANPAIGDAGIAPLCDILPQDLWIKAIDLQGCGITDEGADSLYKSIESNQTLVVLDVRNNPMVGERKVRDILASILLNAQSHDEIEYPWVKHSYPKLNHFTNQRRKPNISKVRSTYMPPGDAVARKEHSKAVGNNKQRSSQIRAQKVSTSVTNVSQANARNRVNGCKNSRCERYKTMLEEKVGDMKRKLQLADDLEKALKEMVINLETENFELKNQLNETEENMTIKSRLSDETLLENVEQSFNKFHEFLDKLHDVGLGSLVAQSGLNTVGVGCLDNLSALSSINDKSPAGGDVELPPQNETTQIIIDKSATRKEEAIGDDMTQSRADAARTDGVAEKGDSPALKEDAQLTTKDEESEESSRDKVETKGESVNISIPSLSAIKEERSFSSSSSSGSSITTPTFSTSNS